MAIQAGIDLGTTYSATSWYDAANRRVETLDLESADGAKMVRSVVYYPGAGQPPVIGEAAWNARRQYPDRVIVGVKRAMGTDWTCELDGVSRTAPEVSAEILRTLVADAQIILGEPVRDVVITVPAWFGDAERAATEQAGRLAGLNVLGTLPEPHAAALAYAIERLAVSPDRALLVYDLGGGTFDVTLIRAVSVASSDQIDLSIDTICKAGNAHLGGLDWDKCLAEIVAEKASQAYGVDLQDPISQAVLLDNCEKAKRHLSKTSTVSVVADLAGHAVDVTRDEFETRTSALLLQTDMLIDQVLAEAEAKHKITRDQVDIMLTGGSSRMPMVKDMLQAKLGRPPLQYGNPELQVTVGAAYRACVLAGRAPQRPVPQPGGGPPVTKKVVVTGLTDVSSYSIGVEVVRPDGKGGWSRFNSVVVPAGARYGEVFEKEFRTAEAGITEVYVIVYKGESGPLDGCEELMSFTIGGLPPGRPADLPVRVSLSYDDSGILRGKAVDVTTSKEVEIVIDRSGRSGAAAA